MWSLENGERVLWRDWYKVKLERWARTNPIDQRKKFSFYFATTQKPGLVTGTSAVTKKNLASALRDHY